RRVVLPRRGTGGRRADQGPRSGKPYEFLSEKRCGRRDKDDRARWPTRGCSLVASEVMAGFPVIRAASRAGPGGGGRQGGEEADAARVRRRRGGHRGRARR